MPMQPGPGAPLPTQAPVKSRTMFGEMDFGAIQSAAGISSKEAIIGRHKLSGAPLGMTEETDTPDFTSPAMPANAHIGLANPRTPATDANLILRRGLFGDLS